MDNNMIDENDEWELDMVRGTVNKKRKMAVLNKTHITKYELDELLGSGELY